MSQVEPGRPSGRRVDSDWWQVVAAAGAFFVLAYVVGLLAFLAAFGSVMFGVAGGPPELLAGGFGVAFLLFALLALVGLVLAVLLPVALYFDAQAVTEANVGWRPDPTLYAIAGVVGLFAQGLPIQPAVAFYYLYKRREAVGTP
jgi:hypothetical protein